MHVVVHARQERVDRYPAAGLVAAQHRADQLFQRAVSPGGVLRPEFPRQALVQAEVHGDAVQGLVEDGEAGVRADVLEGPEHVEVSGAVAAAVEHRRLCRLQGALEFPGTGRREAADRQPDGVALDHLAGRDHFPEGDLAQLEVAVHQAGHDLPGRRGDEQAAPGSAGHPDDALQLEQPDAFPERLAAHAEGLEQFHFRAEPCPDRPAAPDHRLREAARDPPAQLGARGTTRHAGHAGQGGSRCIGRDHGTSLYWAVPWMGRSRPAG